MSFGLTLAAPTPYVPEKQEEYSSILVKWCKDLIGPSPDYFEIYRYTGFLSYLIVEDPNNLTEEDQTTIDNESVEFYGRPENLFLPGAGMYNHALKQSILVGATRNIYYTDRSVLEEEYYTYLIAGIFEEERTDGLESYVPIGSEPNGWYRKISYLYPCSTNSLAAKDLYITNGVWEDDTWTTSEFCQTPYGSFDNKKFTEPTDELAEVYNEILLP